MTRSHPGTLSKLPRAASLIAVAALMLLAGCGKPQYCSDRNELQQSIQDLRDVEVLQSGGVSQLRSQLQEVEANAQKVVSSAKGDFPSESSALQSSVSRLKGTVQQLPESPSRQEVGQVAANVAGVATSFREFRSATESKC
jgi:hypothetical protein